MNQEVIEDRAGAVRYAAEYRENRAKNAVIGAMAVLLMSTLVIIGYLATKPREREVIRIDSVGKAEVIRPDALHYTPQDAEIRTALWNWANYRFALRKATAMQTYPLNYNFMERSLSDKLMPADLKSHKVADVVTGASPENDIEVNSIVFTPRTTSVERGHSVTRGAATIDLLKIFSPDDAGSRCKEHQIIPVTFEVDPTLPSDGTKLQLMNPLGIFVTYFSEQRTLDQDDCHDQNAR